MCLEDVIDYACGHCSRIVIPCSKCLDGETEQCSALEPYPHKTLADLPCSECRADGAHDDDMETVLERIGTDPVLAPVKHSGRARDPDAPILYFMTRQSFVICGHYWKLEHTAIEREEQDLEWIDDPQPGSCYPCCETPLSIIQHMKDSGEWVGDPWGVMVSFRNGKEEAEPVAGPSQAGLEKELRFDLEQIRSYIRDDEDDLDYSPDKNKSTASNPPPYQTLLLGAIPPFTGPSFSWPPLDQDDNERRALQR